MGLNHSPTIVTEGLVLYLDAANIRSYPGTGTGWFDLSGRNNHGTIVNNPTFSRVNNGIFTFDGTDDYVTMPSTASLTASQPTVIIGCTINNGTVLAKGQYGDHWNYGIGGVASTSFFARNNGCDISSGSVFSSTSGYVIVAAAYNGTSVDFYRNGAYGTSVVGCYSPSPTNSLTLTVGAAATVGTLTEYYSGSVAFVQVYNRCLNALEIKQNFDALRGRFGI